MDQAGIDKSFVFAGELNDCSNEYMLEQIAPHRDRLYGVAAYNPPPYSALAFYNKSLIDLYLEKKIVAVKFYLGYEHYYPSDVGEVLRQLEMVGCPAIFHCGDCLNSVKRLS